MNGKRVLVVDDVISTGGSLKALDDLAEQTQCTIVGQAAVLAEGDAAERKDIIFLEPLPLFFPLSRHATPALRILRRNAGCCVNMRFCSQQELFVPFAAFFVAVCLLLCIPDRTRKASLCLLLGAAAFLMTGVWGAEHPAGPGGQGGAAPCAGQL